MDPIHAFKAARARGEAADLSEFLPRRDAPHYRTMRRELLRADLEFAWQEGKRKLLLDYVGAFPDLLADRATIEELAFAEYRLRLLAGEDPALGEYQWQYGLPTSDWPERARAAARLPIDQGTDGDLRTEIVPAPAQVLTRIIEPTPKLSEYGSEAEPEVEAACWLNEAMSALPAVGTQFLSFQLIAELGRGGFGRVYLARQGDLANRLVALKITVEPPGEEQKLAQLQHTNVVPIYSFHGAGNLHAVCMPYFGATTLADIIRGLQIHAKLPDSGKSIANTVRTRRGIFLDKAGAAEQGGKPNAVGPALPGAQPHGRPGLPEEEDVSVTLALLEETPYVEAVLWLAERLTEGLSHAHERGILHRDLKPANILLTDDGQPMLLDFNLSADTKLGAGLKEKRVGGTVPYMAPEHLTSLQGGPSVVDERSDVFALGVILYEMLTGRLPFAPPSGPMTAAMPALIAERKQPPPLLRPWNSAVSFAVESLVRHCLEGDPGRRYQSARQLREDLKRQRQHRPLRYAAEPSVRERLQKWVRRHPRLASPTTLGAVTALVLALAWAPVSWETWKEYEKKIHDDANQTVESMRADERAKAAALAKYGEFRASLGAARAVMESVNAVQVLPSFMKAWECEETKLQNNAAKCRGSLDFYEVLRKPAWQDQPMVRHLPDNERGQLRKDVSELLFVLAQADLVPPTHLHGQARLFQPVLGVLVVHGAGVEIWGAWQASMHVPVVSALDLNERARRCWADDALPRAVLIQQAELLQQVGQDAQAKQVWTLAHKAPLCPGTEDAYWTASALAAKGECKKALPLLNQTVAQTPDHYGAWLLRGLCLTPKFSVASLTKDQIDRQQALECFTTCIVMRPNALWAYYNRGLVSYHLSLNGNAVADFDRLLQKGTLDKHPTFATAYVPRATALLGMGEYEAAEADLTNAIALDPDVSEYYFLRAKIRRAQHKTAAAQRDEQHVLNATPATAEGWTYRGMVRSAAEPRQALADFDKALALDPEEPLTLFVKGRLLAQVLKRPEEAIPVLDKALTVKPDYHDARLARSLAHAALGARTLAHKDADAVLKSDPAPHMYYQAARVYALTSRRHPADARFALELLKTALRHGYGADSFRQDRDLAPLQKMPGFERLGAALKDLGALP